jgi:hypothetical protein
MGVDVHVASERMTLSTMGVHPLSVETLAKSYRVVQPIEFRASVRSRSHLISANGRLVSIDGAQH